MRRKRVWAVAAPMFALLLVLLVDRRRASIRQRAETVRPTGARRSLASVAKLEDQPTKLASGAQQEPGLEGRWAHESSTPQEPMDSRVGAALVWLGGNGAPKTNERASAVEPALDQRLPEGTMPIGQSRTEAPESVDANVVPTDELVSPVVVSERDGNGEPAQRQAEVVSRLDREGSDASRRLPPERRSGRPRREVTEERGTRPGSGRTRQGGDEPFLLRCRLEGMHWVIGVEPTREDVILLQGDVELQPASIVDPFYPLASLDDDVVILDAEGETAHPVLPRDIVLFLLLSPRDGVEADSIEVGLQYLLLAKERVLEGFDDVSVEGVALEGWRAYLFTAEEDHARRLREKYGIDTRRSAEPTLHFDGRRVVGVADQYRVFADPPVVNWSGENADAIVQLIIRRERPADDQPFVWSFPVDGPGSALPAAVQEDLRRIGAGRFSVRAYDAQQRLVVSGDFRFAAGLREVRIVERSVDRVKVAFDLEAGYIIEPYGMDLAMEHEEGAVVFTVRPDQRQARREFWDLVEWRLIAPSRCSVLIGVDLERVVSACGESADPPAAADWGVEPVLLTRADLRAVSPKRLWVWVPQTLQGQLVLELQAEDGRVERIRRFRRRRKLVEIPLRELEHLREELPGRFAIVLRPTEELVWRIGTLQLMATCSLCGREFEKIETMWHHIHVCHIAELFQEIDPLEWFEISGRHLPKTVYQCRYCDKGFPDDGYDNANTSLHQHQQSECQRARQDAGDGPVQDRFRILTVDQHDPREIARALVGERWRCRLCGTEVTREQQRDHLVASHRAELIDLC